MNNKNKNLLPFLSEAVSTLCAQMDAQFELEAGYAEMLIIEVTAKALMEADRGATSTYLALLATELPQEDDFDRILMDRARRRVVDAVSENI